MLKKLAFILVGLTLLVACDSEAVPDNIGTINGGVAMTIKLTSPAFTQGQAIPAKFSCQGQDLSPALEWSEIPAGAKSLALIMDDPDAPGGTWTHWLIFNLPPTGQGLPENVAKSQNGPSGSLQGKNSWGNNGYGGPCPPSGTHRYFFRLYALDNQLEASAGSGRDKLLKAIEGHILARAELMGTYRKS